MSVQAPEIEVELEHLESQDQSWDTLSVAPLEYLRKRFGSLGAFHCWGRMENLRRVYPWPGADSAGVEIEVDRTLFPGAVVEYELEVENDNPEAITSSLTKALGQWGVNYKPQTRSKSERLSYYLSKLEEE